VTIWIKLILLAKIRIRAYIKIIS